MEPQADRSSRDDQNVAGTASTSRRRFLGALTAAAGGALAAGPAAPLTRANPTRLHLQDCRIAGSRHYACDDVLSRLRVGDPLQLHRQANNPHDQRAIEVLARKRRRGNFLRKSTANAMWVLQRGRATAPNGIGSGNGTLIPHVSFKSNLGKLALSTLDGYVCQALSTKRLPMHPEPATAVTIFLPSRLAQLLTSQAHPRDLETVWRLLDEELHPLTRRAMHQEQRIGNENALP